MNKTYLATYTLDCGHGVKQKNQDIVFAPSKNQAREKLSSFLKSSLPEWRAVKNLKLIEL